MGNAWFQFREFRVEQGRSAMKVCTDACLFGAWAKTNGAVRVLDVGCGTGLLSLMAAQQNPACRIDAIEPDEGSYRDALLNVENSPWSDRIQVIQTDWQRWAPDHASFYDVVLCNPPFFLNHLASPESSRNQSLHLDLDAWADWLSGFQSLLKPDGILYLLLSADGWVKTPKQLDVVGAYSFEAESVLQRHKKPFRVMVRMQFMGNVRQETSWDLYDAPGVLSDRAMAHLRDFYLPRSEKSV